MLKQTKIAFLVSALLAGAAFANTSSTVQVADQPIAREAGEGGRGRGAEGEGRRGGDPRAIEVKDQLARRGADDRQTDDRGGRGGADDPVDGCDDHGDDRIICAA